MVSEMAQSSATANEMIATCQDDPVNNVLKRPWQRYSISAVGGAIVGAGLIYCFQVADRLNLPGTWDTESKISLDTLGTWLGTIATVAIAIAGWVYGWRISKQQKRAESLQATILASEFQFRVRPVRGGGGIWDQWRLILYTAEKAPATDIEVMLDGSPFGDGLDLLRMQQAEPWGWQPVMPLNMPNPTTDEKEARSFIRAHVRDRLDIRFTVAGHRYSRSANGLRSLGKVAYSELQ